MRVLFILSLAIALTSCGNSKNNASKMKSDSEISKATIGDINQESDPVEINSVSIDGNIMTINVSFSGGCEDHKFNLVGSAAVMKSLPAKRPVALIHGSNEDNCEAYLSKNIQFDISELAISQQNGSEIYLIIGEKEYLYQYKLEK